MACFNIDFSHLVAQDHFWYDPFYDRWVKMHGGTLRFKVLSNCRINHRAQCLWKLPYLSLHRLTRHVKNASKLPGLISIVDRSQIWKSEIFPQELQVG